MCVCARLDVIVRFILYSERVYFFLFFSPAHFSVWETLLNFGAKFCHLHCSSIVETQPLFSVGLGARFHNALV